MLALVRKHGLFTLAVIKVLESEEARGRHMKVSFKLLAVCVRTRRQRLLERERDPFYGSEKLVWTVRKYQSIYFMFLRRLYKEVTYFVSLDIAIVTR